MDRSTFEVLLQITQERLTIERTPRIPLHTKVLMALWLLDNQESFRGVVDRFGVNKGLLHYVVNNIIELWAGSPGRMHDAKVFSASGLDKLAETLPPNFHILDDSAYALSVGLMRPYRNNGHLS
ncbi:hypothetical protein HPB49_003561 [Dermacentor silvarum]|uniref:Uncharacterized protein n=1 Tax=Dermacentor silvarum TaxID=543639 RepID=A0ACB8CDE7_DERSI|nr:hypothetical protein HPB49_003561 [Dermacentor silvarum]